MNRLLLNLKKQEQKVLKHLKKEREELDKAIAALEPKGRPSRKWTAARRAKFRKTMAAKKKAV